jgi:hypothetical protein
MNTSRTLEVSNMESLSMKVSLEAGVEYRDGVLQNYHLEHLKQTK